MNPAKNSRQTKTLNQRNLGGQIDLGLQKEKGHYAFSRFVRIG